MSLKQERSEPSELEGQLAEIHQMEQRAKAISRQAQEIIQKLTPVPQPIEAWRMPAISLGEAIAWRTSREQHSKVVTLLCDAGLEGEVVELVT